jgi:hypothetical protein
LQSQSERKPWPRQAQKPAGKAAVPRNR